MKDRLNNTYEHVFHLVKSRKYYFDLDAIREKTILPSDYYSKCVSLKENKLNGNKYEEKWNNPAGKNPGDVFTIPTQPYPEAHFATYPEKLLYKPIMSSCPQWICEKCGKARERIVESEYNKIQATNNPDKTTRNPDNNWDKSEYPRCNLVSKTIGWISCSSPEPTYHAGVVLDPFHGAGTTAKVCKDLNREYIGIEIKQEYIDISIKRFSQQELF